MTPLRISVARTCSLLQTMIATTVTVLAAAFTLAAFAADHAATRAGNANGWAGFGEFLGTAVAVLALAAVLLVALPALRLRADRPGARYALVVGEVVTSAPILVLFALGLHAQGQGLARSAAAGWLLCSVAALIALGPQRRTSTVPSTPGPR